VAAVNANVELLLRSIMQIEGRREKHKGQKHKCRSLRPHPGSFVSLH